LTVINVVTVRKDEHLLAEVAQLIEHQILQTMDDSSILFTRSKWFKTIFLPIYNKIGELWSLTNLRNY
jgi:hypothetical protein